jgi:GNAT superfamily N-acetyltransferase
MVGSAKLIYPQNRVLVSRIDENDPKSSLIRGTAIPALSSQEVEALHFLLPLSKDYPGIEEWFHQKVIPGVRAGTRTILRVERDGNLVGVGIGKNEHGERKICTVRVAPEYFGRGIGVRLFDRLMEWLNDDKPHLTVGEAKLPLFDKIFDRYGFDLTSKRQGLYLPHVSELGFNDRASNGPDGHALEKKPAARDHS